jgi:uncharacterized protein (TIGR00730 family)
MSETYQKFHQEDPWRIFRIMAEFVDSFETMSQVGPAVTVFGSARTKTTDPYYKASVALAKELAKQNLAVITGGGPGIMEAAHTGGARVDSRLNVGLNISLPFEQHLNPYVDVERAFQFHYFFMRKFWLVKLARGAVFFPGGFGTLDELFELLTLTQTGKVSRLQPIILYGREFWDGLVDFGKLADRGLISPEDVDLFRICDDVDAAFEFLRDELQPHPAE